MKKTTIALALLLWAASLFGQYSYFYGKNKIVRQAFPWKYADTKNFRIYHYIDDKDLLNRVAVEAEKAYEKLSSLLNVTIEERTPIIFYNKQTDLEQTNLYPGIIAPGSFEGFTEPVGHRVVIYGNRTAEDLGRLIIHELSHSFEFAILYKNRPSGMFDFNRPPLWVLEGFAEFMTGYWDSFNLMTVIDAVLSDRMPVMQEDGDVLGSGSNRTPYDFGHLMYEFFYEKFGKKGIRDLLLSQRRPALVSKRRSFMEQFNFTAKTFNYEFKKYARNRFRAFIGRENPEDYSFIIGPDFPFAYSFSHQVSPGGELLAVVTVNYRSYKIEIILVSLKDGKVIKNVTPGYQSTYDGIDFKFIPSDGRSFSWDRRGENIAFFARKELDSYLVVLNALDNRVVREFRVGEIQKPGSPVFHPRQDRLLFTGIEGIHSFLYSLDLKSGQVRKLTDGRTYVKAVDISSNGEKVVYSAAAGQFDKLFLAASENPDQAVQLTGGAFNDIAPSFSADDRTVYYSSDEIGAYNVCSLDLESRLYCRHSDVRTGNFFPVEIPGQKGQLVISSYHKGSFLLFKKDTAACLARRTLEFGAVPPAPAAPAAPGEAPALTLTVKKYKPFEKLIISSLPPVNLGIDTGGGFYGSSYLNVTDMLGDHNFTFYLASYYGYRSYHLAYLNQRAPPAVLRPPVLRERRLLLSHGEQPVAFAAQPHRRRLRPDLPLQPLDARRGEPVGLSSGGRFRLVLLRPGPALRPVLQRLRLAPGGLAHQRNHALLLLRAQQRPHLPPQRRQILQAVLQIAGRLYAGGGRPQVCAPRQLLPARLPPERLLLGRPQRPALLDRRQQHPARRRFPQPGRQQGLLLQRRGALPPGPCRPDPHRRPRPGARRLLLRPRRPVVQRPAVPHLREGEVQAAGCPLLLRLRDRVLPVRLPAAF